MSLNFVILHRFYVFHLQLFTNWSISLRSSEEFLIIATKTSIPSQRYFFICTFQNYDGEIVDDYITGMEQVGADPTVAVETELPVETVVPVDTKEKVDPDPDVYEFKEYDLKEYDYGNHNYGDPDAKPTSAVYEEEFGPGVPAETDIRESNVSGRRCRWVV